MTSPQYDFTSNASGAACYTIMDLMSATGHNWTCRLCAGSVRFSSEADIHWRVRDVGFVPVTDNTVSHPLGHRFCDPSGMLNEKLGYGTERTIFQDNGSDRSGDGS